MSPARLYATAAALLGWFGVVLQLVLTLTVDVEASRTTRFFNFISYFTILSNILAAVVLTVQATRGEGGFGRFFARPEVLLAATVYMTITGLVYFFVLRHTDAPQGLSVLSNALLHYVMPPVMVLFWLAFAAKGMLSPGSIGRVLVFPLLYAAYTLVRGPLVDWYPYPFTDLRVLTMGAAVRNIIVFMVGFAVVTALYVAIDRAVGGGAAGPRRRPA